jgi:hypothetical protein
MDEQETANDDEKKLRSEKFGNALRRLMEKAGWGPSELANATGINRTLVSRHLNGRVFPNLRTRRDYSEALKMKFLDFEEFWREFNIVLTPGGPGIPVLNRSPAGEVVDYHECYDHSGIGHSYIPYGSVTDPLAFCVIITGDSMSGELEDGDEAIFVPIRQDGRTMTGGEPVTDGEIVHVRFAEASKKPGCTVALVYRLADGRIELRKNNTRKYRSIICSTPDIAQMSVLVQFRRNRRKNETVHADGYEPTTSPTNTPRPNTGEESQVPANWSE